MPGLQPTQQDIDQFVAITQASPEQAQHFLSTGTTLEGAIEDYFAAQGDEQALEADEEEELDDLMAEEPESNDAPPAVGGPRTLGGTAATDTALPAGWGQPARRTATIGELRAAESANRSRGRSDSDDDDDDETRRGETLFAGGERSGLAIQNPDQNPTGGVVNLVGSILRQAAANTPDPVAQRHLDLPRHGSTAFQGQGHALGSEDDPAPEAIPLGSSTTGTELPAQSAGRGLFGSFFGAGPASQRPAEAAEPVVRHLTFWRDGFTIEDGSLYRYEDRRSRDILESIQAGRAPLSLFGVAFNQQMSLEIAERRSDDYVPPPAKPFSGGGNRLGSPTPQVATAADARGMPGGLPTSAASGPTSSSSTQAIPNRFEVDESKPTTSVQVRLADGTRLVVRANLTHTVADLRGFVSASRPQTQQFVLQTTFPNRELSDASQTIEEAKLQNAVIVQRLV